MSQFGWVDRPAAVVAALATMPMPVFRSAAANLAGSGAGKNSLLWKAQEKVTGTPFPVYEQKIGDCVSWGGAITTQILASIEILAGEQESWGGEIATEALYALSRVEVGGGQLGNEDGSLGAWMAKALTDYGTLIRKSYGGVDLTTYNPSLAKSWGRTGLPNELEPVAREHPVKTASNIRSFEELRDAAANGYPAFICSMQGFEGQQSRDSNGFLKPRGQWAHCMPCIGVIDEGNRPAAVIYNQWGRWLSGPRPFDIPECAFLADADVVDKMLRQGDSFTIGGFVGFPLRPIDYFLF